MVNFSRKPWILLIIVTITFFAVLATLIPSLLSKNDARDKWGYYDEADSEMILFDELVKSVASYEQYLVLGTMDSSFEVFISDNRKLLEILDQSTFNAYHEQHWKETNLIALSESYKSIILKSDYQNNEQDEWRRLAIRLIDDKTYLIVQDRERNFSIYQSEDSGLYNKLRDYYEAQIWQK